MSDRENELEGMKGLIVDDTPTNIDILRKTLEPKGYSISVAASGELALKVVERQLPDLVLLDVMMPGINGYETCRKIKQDDLTKDLPVIFITAKTEINDLVEGFASGGIDYVTKPFHQDEILARVESQLRLRKLVKQKEQLIGELEEARDQLELSSKTDALTGLLNRRGLQERMEEAKYRYERNRVPFSLVLADIDHFKKVNDSFGHEAGDEALVFVAKVLLESSRKQDVVCRWGGEEFMILLPDTRLKGGERWAEKARSAVESAKLTYKNLGIPLTLSLGVSEFETFGQDIDDCIRTADNRLYRAKSMGRNMAVASDEK